MKASLACLLLLAGTFQGALAARQLQQIDPSVNTALNQQLQGVINNAQPLVNSFAQSVSNGLRNFNYSSIDWERFANKVNSAANETMSRIIPQPNVTAINEDADKGMENLNKTIVENTPRFYDNFHWEKPTLLNETLNELPLKDVVNQAINDQEPLLDRPEFYKAMNSLPVRPIFADGSVESFAQTSHRSTKSPATAPAPAPELDAVSSAVNTVVQGIGALAYDSPAAAPVAAALERVAALATAPATGAGGNQIMGPLATFINTVTTGTPLNAALTQARSAVAATPVGAVVDNARTAVGTAVANSPIGAVVDRARTAAAPVESILQSARSLAAAPVTTILQRAGSTIGGAPGAAPLLQAARNAATPVAPLLESARTALAQAPVGPLLQAARTAVASSPIGGIVTAVQNMRLPALPEGASASNAQVNSYARSPAPSTNGSPLANVFNVSEIAQGFTQQLNAAINNGVPALLPENPIDLVVRAINTNGGRVNTNDITTRQSFQESRTEDGASAMTPLDEAKTESEGDKESEESTSSQTTDEKQDESAPEAASTKSDTEDAEKGAESSEASTSSAKNEAENADNASDSGKEAPSSSSEEESTSDNQP
eukprot:jgi/Botrbrau1/2347/Bobra.39_1s0034.2